MVLGGSNPEAILSVVRAPTAPLHPPFIGRGRERAQLIREIEAGARLITITGPSGIGKTRLSKRVRQELGPLYEEGGGTLFCSLEGAQSDESLQAAVAEVLGASQLDEQALIRVLAQRGPMLLVLDNLESLAGPALSKALRRWLERCESLQILATSVVPLDIEGELRFELGQLEESDAVELYLDRAKRAWAGREEQEGEREMIGALVNRLDRMPLAIELAAARVRILPPSVLLSRIDERLQLLRTTGVGRHGSLIQALALTWEFLTPEEQRFLARASLFVGGFTLDAAERVLTEGGGATDVHSLLDELRSKMLLQLGDSDPFRFSMFESTREYGRLKFDEDEQRSIYVQRFIEFYAAEQAQHVDPVEGPASLGALGWLRDERENLLAAYGYATASAAPATAIALALAAAAALAKQGMINSQLEVLESALAIARTAGGVELLLRVKRSKVLALIGMGRFDRANRTLEEGLELAREAGERLYQGYFLSMQGFLRGKRQSEIEHARNQLEEALRISEELGDQLLEGFAHLRFAMFEVNRGAFEEGVAHYQRSLEIARELGLLQVEGRVLANLSSVLPGLGKFREARLAAGRAKKIYRGFGDSVFEACLGAIEGSIALVAGQLDEAEALSSAALAPIRATGRRAFEAAALANLGFISLEKGETKLAEQRLNTSLGIFMEIEDRRCSAECLAFLSVVEAKLGDWAESRRCMEEARGLFAAGGDQSRLAMVDLLEGVVEAVQAAALEGEGAHEEASSLRERARARLAKVTPERFRAADGGFQAIRLLEQALTGADVKPDRLAASDGAEGLVVGPEMDWFEFRGGGQVDLGGRRIIRRLLRGLVEKRLSEPGVGLRSQELFELGWGGDTILEESANARIYTSIWTLRSMGLASLIIHGDQGYFLDPTIPVVRLGA